MQISVIAVGRLRPGPEKDLVDTYSNRIKWPLSFIEVEERRPIKGPERMRVEAELITKALPANATIIALDERGRDLNSPEFAKVIEGFGDAGANHIAFIIGGADGLQADLRERAKRKICFGRMTWPHMMVRAMLTEQIYRAGCILSGHPYHK